MKKDKHELRLMFWSRKMEFAHNKSGNAILLITYSLMSLLPGCTQTRYEQSLIHPHPKDKPFQECSVNLDTYKSVQSRCGQDANLAIAVAASGGGYRAANFAAGALLGLEEITAGDSRNNNALSQVDYFSTVSGGGFAVGTYISSLHDYLYFKGTFDGYSFAEALAQPAAKCPCRTAATDQSYDPCIRSHLQGLYRDFINDFLKTLLPWERLGFHERGFRFEQAIDDDILGYRWRKEKLTSLSDADVFGTKNMARNASLLLSDVFLAADDNQTQMVLPYWVTNATVYENGAIFAFTPDQLREYKITGYPHRLKKYRFAYWQENYNVFLQNVPLAVGVTSSANFPFALPANTLTSQMDPNNPYVYLLDGGLADNLGVFTAVRLLDAQSHKAIVIKTLIVIDSYQGGLAPFSNIKNPPAEADTAVRALQIGLDSWRVRYRKIIDDLCKSKDIHPVYLSFDDLLDADFNDLYPFGLSEKDKLELCKKKSRNCPNPTPFLLVRSISMTSPVVMGEKGLEYRLPPSQQNLLLASGRYVVHKKKPEILAALAWE